MIKIAIIDDEQKSIELLTNIIQKNFNELSIAGTASSVSDGLEMISQSKPDLVFLDIEIAGETGFDLLEKIQHINFDVIFTTAYDKYALKAIKYSALDYLLKPIDIDELKIAIEKVRNKQNSSLNIDNLKFLLQNFGKKDAQFSKITLPTGNAFEVINIADIIRCESEGHYTNFIMSDGRKLLVSISLKYYEDILPPDSFIRIHNSHLININHVLRVLKSDGGYVIMSDSSQVEISRRKKDVFLQKLQQI